MSEHGPEEPVDGAEEPREDEGVPEGEAAESPPPATYAGRRAQAGNAGDPAPDIEEVEAELSAELAGEGGEVEDAAAEDEEAPKSSDTDETDTLVAGDREQAQEAALTGLRERAEAEQARRRATGQTSAVGPPAAPVAEAAVTPPPAPPPIVDVGSSPSRWSLWARFVAASFLIVASMATATAVSGLVFAANFADELRPIPGIASQLVVPEGGKPQTILILGSDTRAGGGETYGRSDTTILLRIDPGQDAIRLMSIPRDLEVNIPGLGVDKVNAAYAYGGPKKTLEVVKQLTGLEINHVVNIDFNGFADAVDAIGCVYVDADRHYYIPPETGVSAIDIEAGYQRMCGYKALSYVRYRHTDNDIVRATRQQDFLREARQQVPTSKLINPFSGTQQELEKIFTKYTSSDIDDGAQVINMLKLFIAARNAEVTEIHFPALLGGPTDPYVTAESRAVQKVVGEFLGETPVPAEQPGQPSNPSSRGNGGQKPSKPPSKPAPTTMSDVSDSGFVYADAIYDDRNTRFPLLYPTRVVPGSSYSDDSRSFLIDGPGNDVYHGYKFVISRTNAGYYEYYGVSGTDWKDPPILANPSTTKTINGRDYLLFYDSGRLRLVGWKTQRASYWVDNTLQQTITVEQMLAVANSVKEYKP